MVTVMETSGGAESLTLTVHSDDDDCLSSHSSNFDGASDLMTAAMGDDVTAQLAAAGWIKQASLGEFSLCLFSF